MTAESAARELANQIWSIALSNAYGKPERDVIGEITTLITQAILAAEQRGKEAQLMTSEVWGLIQAAEQRGIERACEAVQDAWSNDTKWWDVQKVQSAIRALAQGGENENGKES